MTAAAKTALAKMGDANGFTVDATTDTSLINDQNLAGYQVFLQMHLAPFEINLEQRIAVEHFILQGKGWVGIHGAGLIIPSSYVKRAYPNWDLYSNLLGWITYVIHPALQNGTVVMEDRTHPATKNLPATFPIIDEWYEWDASPRGKVRVLGKADEKTYTQVTPMGDHPMIWTSEQYQRTIYIGIGHDASDWNNASFSTLVRDALLWSSTGTVNPIPPADAGNDGTEAAPSDAGADASFGAAGAAGNATGTGTGGTAMQGGGAGGMSMASGGAGTGGSAGAPAGGGASAMATGGTSAGGASGDGSTGSDAGCSCRVDRATKANAAGTLWLMAAALLGTRRRRNGVAQGATSRSLYDRV